MNRFLVLLALPAVLGVAALSAETGETGAHSSVPAGDLELCLVCHGEIEDDLGHSSIHAPLEGGDCTSCHDPHVARFKHLLRRESERLCMSCHTNLRDEMRRPIIHAALKADDACVQCHDPHASDHAGLLREEAGVLCAECHEQVAGRWTLEHAHSPAADGDCAACHEAHAGSDFALLSDPVPGVCVTCHATGSSLDAAHQGFAVSDADCGDCHAPHGAAKPGLPRPLGHSPFDDGDCADCHTNPREPALLTVACEDCHGDYSGDGGSSHHAILGSCTDCHSPHAGEAPALMSGPQHLVCLACHTDIGEEITRGTSYHPRQPDSGTCSACHQAHGSKDEPLLIAAEAALCEDCHDDHSRFTHPMGPNVPDQRRPGKSIDCLSCHDPHASEQKMMLTDAPDRDLCVACHVDLHGGG